MEKTNVIRAIDSYLYENTLKRINKLYVLGLELNRGRQYVYHFFRPDNPYVETVPPSAALVEFLSGHREEFEAAIKHRRLITAYLTRYMNQCKQPSTITHLLPNSIAERIYYGVHDNQHDEQLVVQFKQYKEFGLIQEQAVFNKMGL